MGLLPAFAVDGALVVELAQVTFGHPRMHVHRREVPFWRAVGVVWLGI